MVNNSFWRNKKVLVTGHTGFKGSWLITWLLSLEAEVWGYSLEADEESLFNSIRNDLGGKLIHYEEDILNLNKLNKFIESCQPDVIFHLAAQSLVRKSYLEPLNTWNVNVIGSLNLLEATKSLKSKCAIVMITTDKVYKNREWLYGYRENDQLGGIDPYSSSKAGAEIAISSWRSSFCGNSNNQNPNIHISTARAGNVIGGGDWAVDRIIPDLIKALKRKETVIIRNPNSTRPWQHVLEPLSGYLILAEKLYYKPEIYSEAFNFGPDKINNKRVQDLVELVLSIWPGEWSISPEKETLHEAGLLHLQSDKSAAMLKWKSIWGFETTIRKTINWYKEVYEGKNPFKKCMEDIIEYQRNLIN